MVGTYFSARPRGAARHLILGLVMIAIATTPLTLRAQTGHAAMTMSATQIMNWFPEPEHGGFYTADKYGLYAKYGLNMKILPFSYAYQGLDVLKEIALGKISFGMANADDVYAARAQGLPVVAVLTSMQQDLQCFMWHASDTSIKTLADLSGHTVIYGFGATFWDYLMGKYHYKNVKTINYDFTLRNFALIPNSVNQGYISAEPYNAAHGTPPIPVKAALIASAGYNPYYQVMVTSEDMIKNHPDIVRAYVQATVAGWNKYYSTKAITEAVNAYMRANPTAKSFPMTAAAMDYDVSVTKNLAMGGDAKTHGFGYMSLARWTTLKKQLLSVGLKVGSVNPSSAFTDQFLPKM